MVTSTLIVNAVLKHEERTLEGYAISFDNELALIKKEGQLLLINLDRRTYLTEYRDTFKMIIDYLKDIQFMQGKV